MKKNRLVVFVIITCLSSGLFIGCGSPDNINETYNQGQSYEQNTDISDDGENAEWVLVEKIKVKNDYSYGVFNERVQYYGTKYTVYFPELFQDSSIISVQYSAENAIGEFMNDESVDDYSQVVLNGCEDYIRDGSDQSEVCFSWHDLYSDPKSSSEATRTIQSAFLKIRFIAEVTKNDGTVEIHRYALKFEHTYNVSNVGFYELIDKK